MFIMHILVVFFQISRRQFCPATSGY